MVWGDKVIDAVEVNSEFNWESVKLLQNRSDVACRKYNRGSWILDQLKLGREEGICEEDQRGGSYNNPLRSNKAMNKDSSGMGSEGEGGWCYVDGNRR